MTTEPRDCAAVALWKALKREHYIDDWSWQTYETSPADLQRAADATRPAHFREAARGLRRAGHIEAALLLEHVADDETERTP